MKDLQNYIKDNTIYPFEDFSNTLVLVEGSNGKYYEYRNCSNTCVINEGSFNRLMSRLNDSDYVIMSAYRTTFTKQENIIRNRHLRALLNDNKMGVHQLVGHWREAPDGKEYNKVPQNELVDTIERSYVISRPSNMSVEDFKSFIIKCMTIDGSTQDAVIFHQKGNDYYALYNNGKMEKIGTKMTLNKISQAYSQYIKKLDIPFVFEGVESPSTNLGKQIFQQHNIQYCI